MSNVIKGIIVTIIGISILYFANDPPNSDLSIVFGLFLVAAGIVSIIWIIKYTRDKIKNLKTDKLKSISRRNVK